MMKLCVVLALIGAAAAAPTAVTRTSLVAEDSFVGGLECSACKEAVEKIEEKVEPELEADVQKWADELCADIPGNVTSECEALVAQYVMPFITGLFNKANSTVVCQLAGLCPKMLTGALECKLCQTGVAGLEAKIESNETVTKLMTWADHLCTKAPAPLQKMCDSVLDNGITKVMQGVMAKATPAVVCKDLGVCPKTYDVDFDRRQMIDAINAAPGVTWTAAIHPRFQGTPVGSVKSLCGVHAESLQHVRDNTKRVSAPADDETIPSSFDSATNWPECADVINDIRDQSNCGCCWAFGAAEAASDRMCIANGGKAKLPLSANELCFCASDDGCDGGDIFTPWSFIQEHGLVTGGLYNGTGPLGSGFCSAFPLPHCHHHGPQGSDPYPAEGQPGCPSESSAQCPKVCDDDAKSPHASFSSDRYAFTGEVESYDSERAIQKAIMTAGPVEAAFTVYSDFENYAGGIYHHVSGGMAGGHAIKIVGWGEEDGTKYWKIANSWNPYWGEKGYFRIKRGVDECGIESQVTASSSSSTWAPMK